MNYYTKIMRQLDLDGDNTTEGMVSVRKAKREKERKREKD